MIIIIIIIIPVVIDIHIKLWRQNHAENLNLNDKKQMSSKVMKINVFFHFIVHTILKWQNY